LSVNSAGRAAASQPAWRASPLFTLHFFHSMSIDLQAINIEALKARVGELRRYL
jgi:hypothetical protein